MIKNLAAQGIKGLRNQVLIVKINFAVSDIYTFNSNY